MAKFKQISFISLIALATAFGSGTGVYFLMRATDKSASNGGEFIVPPIPDNVTPAEETDFSKVINNIIASKEITSDKLSIQLIPGEGKKNIELNLLNTEVDLVDLNEVVINLATNLNVQYSGINQTLGIRFEEDEFAYVSFHGKGFTFNAPENLSDLMEIVKTVVNNIPNEATATSDLKVSDILEIFTEKFENFDITPTTNEKGEFVFDINLGTIDIDKTRISNLQVFLTADTNHNVTGVYTNPNAPITISKQDENGDYSNIIQVALGGDLKANKTSTYQKADAKDYTDITGANSSLLGSIAKIIDKKQADVDIAVDVDKITSVENEDGSITETSNREFTVNGLLQVDASNVSKDFDKGTYSLALKHVNNNDEVLNDIGVYYQNETAFLKINDLLKSKISYTSLKDLFTYISKGTGKDAFKVIAGELNVTLGSLDMEALKNGDFSQLNDELLDTINLSYSDYDDLTGSFIIEVSGKLFGLGEEPIRIECKVNNDKKDIVYLKVSGLRFNDLSCSITISPKEFTSIAGVVDADTYKDYRGVVGIFSSLANLVAKKKLTANYSMYFEDARRDENNTKALVKAEGSLGADLTKVDSLSSLVSTDEKTGLSNGTYYLNYKGDVSTSNRKTNLNINYQNQNLYFSLNNAFSNYIEHADLGYMYDVIDSKSSTSSSLSFEKVGEIIDTLNLNPDFVEDINTIKSGSLKGLESFISIDAINGESDKYILTVDVPYIFKDNKLLGNAISAITLTINTHVDSAGDENSYFFDDITISTMLDSGEDSLLFSLSFDEYVDQSLTEEEISKYSKIEEIREIFTAFYNLNTTLKKFNVNVDASYIGKRKENGDGSYTEGTKVSINGNASCDLNDISNPIIGGNLEIAHPYVQFNDDGAIENIQAKQNLQFRYESILDDEGNKIDGQFFAQYNDNLHITMKKSSVSDLMTSISSMSEDNLLYSLLDSADNIATGLPIIDAIKLHAPSLLLEYELVHKVSFNASAHEIVLEVNKGLINAEDDGKVAIITIKYNPGSDTVDPSLTSITVDANIEGVTAKATISLGEYDDSVAKQESMLPYQGNEDKFVDLAGFNKLVQCFIDTTENNYFNISGNINLDLSLLENRPDVAVKLDCLSIDLTLNLSIFVQDETTYFYVDIINGDNHSIDDYGFNATELFIDGSTCYVCNTTNNEGVIESTNFRFDTSDLAFNDYMLYYLADLILDISSRPAGKTAMANIYDYVDSLKAPAIDDNEEDNNENEGSSLLNVENDLSISLSSDFSSIISSAIYSEDKMCFALNLNLADLFIITYSNKENETKNLLDFDSTFIKIYHQKEIATGRTPLYALTMHTGISALDGLAKASVNINLRMNGNNGDIARYSSIDAIKVRPDMNRFFTYIDSFNATYGSDNYKIESINYTTKKYYSFDEWKLKEFINSYSFVDNGKSYRRDNYQANDVFFHI